MGQFGCVHGLRVQRVLRDNERLLEKDQQLKDLQHELDELNDALLDKDAALAAATAGPGRGRPASTEENFMQMRADVG
eukprot:3290447-Prymnesium_polylepis.1